MGWTGVGTVIAVRAPRTLKQNRIFITNERFFIYKSVSLQTLALFLATKVGVRMTFGSLSSLNPSMMEPSLLPTASSRNSEGRSYVFVRAAKEEV